MQTADITYHRIYTASEFAPWAVGTRHWGVVPNNIFPFESVPAASLGVDLRQPSTCDTPETHDMRYRLYKVLKCWQLGALGAHLTQNYVHCDPSSLYTAGVLRLSQPDLTQATSIGGVDDNGERCGWMVGQIPWGRQFRSSDFCVKCDEEFE